MSIKVAIQENVFIKEAKKMVQEDDSSKVSLAITFKIEGEEIESEEVSVLDSFNSSEEEGGDNGGTIRLFPISDKVDEGKEFTPELAKDRIDELKGPLNHILLGYKTKAEIKWDIFKGIPITAETATQLITNGEVLKKISINIFDQFVAMLTPHLAEQKKFRFLAVRQSKKKHYPALRKRFLKDQPFWESMTIPREASKLAFSAYEIKNGLNSNEPAPVDAEESTDAQATSAGLSAGLGLGTRE